MAKLVEFKSFINSRSEIRIYEFKSWRDAIDFAAYWQLKAITLTLSRKKPSVIFLS